MMTGRVMLGEVLARPVIIAAPVTHDPLLIALIPVLIAQGFQLAVQRRNRRQIRQIHRQVTPRGRGTMSDDLAEIRRSQASLARSFGSFLRRFDEHLEDHAADRSYDE